MTEEVTVTIVGAGFNFRERREYLEKEAPLCCLCVEESIKEREMEGR